MYLLSNLSNRYLYKYNEGPIFGVSPQGPIKLCTALVVVTQSILNFDESPAIRIFPHTSHISITQQISTRDPDTGILLIKKKKISQ
jgi:hypothetical protein